jgi:septal ring factor EnvC (AmiA/AmiB activator)
MRDQKLQSYYTSAQIDLIKDLESKNNKLIETKQIIKKTISKIENLKKDKGKVKEQLEDEKNQKKQLLVIVDNEIKNKEQIKQKLIEDEKKLKSIVDELLKKAAKEAKDQIRLKDTKKTKSNETVVPFEGGDFKKLKGKLPYPVKGNIKYQFDTKRKDTGIKWKGIFIAAKEGEEVIAVADGKVAYADWLRGFGNLIIIDHGQGYMSLYGYNESILLNVNDEVKAGDVIATVGNTGGLGIDGLYYELRKDSKPFNPTSWSKK